MRLAETRGMSFRSFPLALNLVLLAVGGIVVWLAGARLAKHTDAVASKTGISRGFLGALMLGGITSLPEIAVSVSATAIGNAHLAANNVLGGIAMQVAILAAADVAIGKKAISTVARTASTNLQGVLLILLLSLTAAGVLIGEPRFTWVGPWAMAILVGGGLGFFLIYRTEKENPDEEPTPLSDEERDTSMKSLVLRIAVASVLILIAGITVANAGDAIGEQTGLGASFAGMVLVAITTSLPEVSTTIGAARLGRADMAFSNIFGTNVFDVALIGIVDLVWMRGPVINELGRFSAVAAMLGIVCTAIYVIALERRRVPSFLRMGIDSMLVLVVYFGGVGVLYGLR